MGSRERELKNRGRRIRVELKTVSWSKESSHQSRAVPQP